MYTKLICYANLDLKTPLCSTITDHELGPCFDWTNARLGSEEAISLVSHVLGVSFTNLHTNRDRIVPEAQVEQLLSAVRRRLRGEPIAYIVGSKIFHNLMIKVTPDVLIPRFETELLIDLVVHLTPEEGCILDLGTGSGAIAIALSKMNQYRVKAVDNDPNALEVCAENCALHEVAVEIIRSNWYENVDGCFDTIVSNPPYVAPHDPHLDKGDLRYEPRNALVAGGSGLAHLEQIILGAPEHLRTGGWVVVEHGYDQRESVLTLFQNRGYAQIQQRQDYAGIPRIVWGQWNGR